MHSASAEDPPIQVQTILKLCRAMHLASPASIICLCLKLQGIFSKHFPLAALRDNAFKKKSHISWSCEFSPSLLTPRNWKCHPNATGMLGGTCQILKERKGLDPSPVCMGLERTSPSTQPLCSRTSCISYMSSLWTTKNISLKNFTPVGKLSGGSNCRSQAICPSATGKQSPQEALIQI